MLTLSSRGLAVTIDPDYGADITSIRAGGYQLLYQTTWREAPQRAIDEGSAGHQVDSRTSWLERYRGGWQLLCPVAGQGGPESAPPVVFHGEASRAAWSVESSDAVTAQLRLDLVSATLSIHRSVQVTDDTIRVADTLRNTGPVDVIFDYAQHIAFGGDLLDSECVIESMATSYVRDWELAGRPRDDIRSAWPPLDESRVDVIPARPFERFEWAG